MSTNKFLKETRNLLGQFYQDLLPIITFKPLMSKKNESIDLSCWKVVRSWSYSLVFDENNFWNRQSIIKFYKRWKVMSFVNLLFPLSVKLAWGISKIFLLWAAKRIWEESESNIKTRKFWCLQYLMNIIFTECPFMHIKL